MPNATQVEPKEQTVTIAIKAVDDDKHLVSGLVYEPLVLDSWGELMLPGDVEQMAHRFMRDVELSKSIDVQHDNNPTTCFPVESFIARKGDPDYAEGAWVVTVKVEDDVLWQKIKKGEINGFSYQCMVRKIPAIVEVETYKQLFGVTEKAEDHEHFFIVDVDDGGVVLSGVTSPGPDGHVHMISGATATDTAQAHTHRFFT